MSAIAFAFLASTPLSAQISGAIEGTVADTNRGVVAGAVVKVISADTGATQHFETNAVGRYSISALPPGVYRVEVTNAGFHPEARTGIVVSAGQTSREDFLLTVGDISASIEVTADRSLLSTSATNWGGAVEKLQLDRLPLRGRDLFDLISQQPGAQLATSAVRSIIEGLGVPVAVDGIRPNMNSFRLDGMTMNDATGSAPASAGGRLLGLEAIQELSFNGSPFNADYGRTGGAQLTAVTRSGTNDWHGSLYDYLRNSALDAKNFFDAPGEKTPPLRKNHFGGRLGGPIERNRLFFFVNLESVRAASTASTRVATLSNDGRQGILNGAAVAISPLVRPYFDLYPEANGRDYGDGTAEYISSVHTATRESYATAKVDSVGSGRIRLSGAYTFDDGRQVSPDYFHTWNLVSDSRYQFAHANLYAVQSAATLHEVRGGFSRVGNVESTGVLNEISARLAFLPAPSVGTLRVSGLADTGGTRDLGIRGRPRVYLVDDTQGEYHVTHLRGNHSLRAGATYDNLRFHQRADINAWGLYVFGSLSDFYQAKTQSGEFMTLGSDTQRVWQMHEFAAFAQDEIHLQPSLTLTLGLRYDANSTPTERNGKIATLRNPFRDSQFTVGGPLYRNPSLRNFAPRAALAWDPTGRGNTVVRAGFGIFYDLITFRELVIAGVRTPPFYQRTVVSKASFPDLLAAAASTTPGYSADALDYYLTQPYVLKYRLVVEHRFSNSTNLRLAYTGSRGAHLTGAVGDYNPTLPQVMDDGSWYFVKGGERRNPALGAYKLRTTQFNSFYQGFTAELQRRWTNGLGLQAGYTFSKSIDETSNSINRDFAASDVVPNPYDIRANRGLSDFDIRHKFSINASYRLPDPGPAGVRRILGGWEVHGLLLAQSGPPFSPAIGFDRANITSSSSDYGERPNLLVTGHDLVLGGPDQYFDPSAFSLPAAGFLGNLGRNVLTGPGLFSLDAALHKVLWKMEQKSLRLRAEVFNLGNHPNFQIPSGTALFNSQGKRLATAGRITETTTTSRQIQLALRLEF